MISSQPPSFSRNLRGRAYSAFPNCAAKPNPPDNEIRSSSRPEKQRYESHMKRSRTAGHPDNTRTACKICRYGVRRALIVELVAEDNHVLEFLRKNRLIWFAVVPDLRLAKEVKPRSLDYLGSGTAL